MNNLRGPLLLIRRSMSSVKMATFCGKNGIIFGGTGGIGLETVRSLLKKGCAKLAVTDILDDCEGQKKLDCEFGTRRLLYKKCLVDDQEQVQTTFQEVMKKFCNLEVVVNSAGVIDEQCPHRMLGINFGGVITTTKFGFEIMRKDKGGRGGYIINIASITGLDPFFGIPVYSATKCGIVGLTRAFIPEKMCDLTKIKIFAICPGFTDTPLIENIGEKAHFSEMKEEFAKFYEEMPHQTAPIVGECLVQAVEDGENGSIWICDSNQIRKAKMQSLSEF